MLVIIFTILVSCFFVTTVQSSYSTHISDISEHCLIPVCMPLFDTKKPMLQKKVEHVFRQIAELVSRYDHYYYGLMGCVIDILRNLPAERYAVIKRVLDENTEDEGFMYDLFFELNRLV